MKQAYPDGMDVEVGTKKYLEISLLGVSDGYGKRGIATQLCLKYVQKTVSGTRDWRTPSYLHT